MAHAIILSEAFQLVHIRVPRKKPVSDGPSGGGGKHKAPVDKNKEANKDTKADKKAPICLYEPHKAKGYSHFLKDCTACPDSEKDIIFKQLADKNAATGP